MTIRLGPHKVILQYFSRIFIPFLILYPRLFKNNLSVGMRNAFLMFLEDECSPHPPLDRVLLLVVMMFDFDFLSSLFEQESAALAMQEQQADDADDVEQLLQREIDAVAVKGGLTPLSSLEADIQGTRAALLAALADNDQEEDSDASGNE